MTRRSQFATVLAVTTVVLAACGGSSAPPIEDPKEILVKAVETLRQATSFQLRADVSGSVALNPSGAGGGQPLDVSGTTLEGAFDVANERVHLTFSAPKLMNTTGELIVVDKVAYLRLLGPKYQRYDASHMPSRDVPTDPRASLDGLRASLDKLATPPRKLANERCGNTDCYHVQVDLDPASMNLGSQEGHATIDVWVRTTDLRPANVRLTADGGSHGSLIVTLELFGYNEAVSITPPPADQVEEGTLQLSSP